MTKQTRITQIETCYAIRITVDDLTLEKTFQCFSNYTKFIIAEEGDGDNTRIHHHVALYTEDKSDVIKALIKEHYPTAKGNKCLYIKPSRDNRQLAKYTLKEGKYMYKGFTEKHIQELFKVSVPKTSLKRDITDLEEKYVLGEITTEAFIDGYIRIKVKHDQPLYTTHLKAYMMKMMLRAGQATYKSYVQTILNDIYLSLDR